MASRERIVCSTRRTASYHPALVSLAALLLCGCGGGGVTQPPRRHLEVQGHRGCRGLRPENTMAAFEHAVRLGVDVLELDLGLTSDGVLVVAHDPEVNETLCLGAERLPRRQIRDLTFEQVQSLDCGARKNPRFPDQRPVPGQRIPRLERVLDLLARWPKVGANIEIKTFPRRREVTWPPARFAQVLVPLLVERGLAGRTTVQSFDPTALREVARLAGRRLVLAALVDRREEIEPMLRATGARVLSPRHSEIEPAELARLQQRGLRVIPWTVNDPPRMKELIGWGVDGIITDRPDLLLKVLRRR